MMSEKYAKTTGEKVLGNLNNIINFKTEERLDILVDKFEEILTETEKVDLVNNLKYGLSLLFIENLETGGKINIGEKMRLKDILEDINGEPKAGDTLDLMKKELRKLKVAENHEELFLKENKTF